MAAAFIAYTLPEAALAREVSMKGAAWWRVDAVTAWTQSLHLPWALILDDSLITCRHTMRLRLTGERPDSALRVFHLLEN